MVTYLVSPSSTLQVNFLSCSNTTQGYLNSNQTTQYVLFDLERVMSSTGPVVVATLPYIGPSYASCGNPVL
jgi:hypothetical protein